MIVSNKIRLPVSADPGKPALTFKKTDNGIFLTSDSLINKNFENFGESVVKEKIFTELKKGVTCFIIPCFKDDD